MTHSCEPCSIIRDNPDQIEGFLNAAEAAEPHPDVRPDYKPFHSVQPFETVPWRFLDELIEFYCPLPEPLILDATANTGRIWGRGKSRYQHTSMDIDPSVHPDVIGDNTAMPFADGSWDIVVYDPPHTGEQGKTKFAGVYGTGVAVGTTGGLAHTYPAFLSEARRVLRPNGLLLVKLADCTHRNKFHFATAEFYVAAREYGFELQGNHILPRTSVIIDPKWKKASHPRQNHSTWMAFKKK
jgi:SAM-dependent methyltransferase